MFVVILGNLLGLSSQTLYSINDTQMNKAGKYNDLNAVSIAYNQDEHDSPNSKIYNSNRLIISFVSHLFA